MRLESKAKASTAFIESLNFEPLAKLLSLCQTQRFFSENQLRNATTREKLRAKMRTTDKLVARWLNRDFLRMSKTHCIALTGKTFNHFSSSSSSGFGYQKKITVR
jgi:hypothetical protein